jgi:hypothetical protein
MTVEDTIAEKNQKNLITFIFIQFRVLNALTAAQKRGIKIALAEK